LDEISSTVPPARRGSLPLLGVEKRTFGSVETKEAFSFPELDRLMVSLRPPIGWSVQISDNTHIPVALQRSAAHTSLPGDPHDVLAGSYWHVGEQQSPATLLPSSHCSPVSRTPFPHTENVTVIVISSTAARSALPSTDSAPPKAESLILAGVHVWPHRSAAPPYVATLSVVGHAPACARSTAPTKPAFTMRTRASTMFPTSAWRSIETVIPWITALPGMVKPKSFARRYRLGDPPGATCAYRSSLVCASPWFVHAALPNEASPATCPEPLRPS